MSRPKPDRYPSQQGRALLTALSTYQQLTIDQFPPAANYSRSSHNYVAKHVTAVTRAGYAEMHLLDRKPEVRKGSRPGVWLLSEKGLTFLVKAGLATKEQLPSYLPIPSPYFTKHILGVNCVLIALQEWARITTGVVLHQLEHDHVLKRFPISVDIGAAKPRMTAADGFVDLEAFDYRYKLWLELDRGTEEMEQWKDKVEVLVRYCQTQPLEEPLTIMVVVSVQKELRPAHRLKLLRGWTEQQLEKMGLLEWADLFRFRTIEPDIIPYGEFFTGPHWVRPFDDILYPLIEAPTEEAWE
jgi:hypothetical protein